MKKNLMWMMAAILTSGFALTACSVDDNPAPNPVLPEDPSELWDKTTTVFDFEDGNAVFAATSRMSVAVQDNAAKGSKVLAFINAGNAQNGYGFAYYNFSELVQKATQVTVKFDYFNTNARGTLTLGDGLVRGKDGVGAGFGRNTYGAKGAIFRIGCNGSTAFINGDNYSRDDLCNKWLNIEVKVNSIEKTLEWIVKDGDEILAQSGTTTPAEVEGEEDVFTPGPVEFWQADANELTQIDQFGWINNAVDYIDNLSIENAIDPAIKYNDYKIRYVDADGKDLKEARVANGREGTDPVLLASDSASFYLNEAGEVVTAVADAATKKIYVSTNAADVKIGENAEVLMVFRDAEIQYAVLACNTEDGILLERFNDVNKYWFYEGDNFTIYPPRGYTKNGSTYFTPALELEAGKGAFNATAFTFPGTLNPTVSGGKTYYIGSLSYAKDETAVYFRDIEDLALPTEDAGFGTGLGQLVGTVNSWYSFSGGIFNRFSGGRGIRLDVNSYVWTEPIAEAGTYTVTIYGRNDSGDQSDKPYVLGLRDAEGNVTEIADVTIPAWGGAVTGSSVIEGVTIPAGSSLVIKNTEEGNLISLDSVTLSKAAE